METVSDQHTGTRSVNGRPCKTPRNVVSLISSRRPGCERVSRGRFRIHRFNMNNIKPEFLPEVYHTEWGV